MLLQVHDELIFETKKENTNKSIEKIREIMEVAHKPLLKLSVPLITETNFGENWDEAH